MIKRKIIGTCLAVALMFGCVGCGDDKPAADNTQKTDEEQLSGGWEDSGSKDLTQEQKDVFDKALETSGGDYTPVAYLASQVVAGTNHSFLCKSGDGKYSVVTVYQDLQDHCEITDVTDADPEKYGDLME